MATKYAAAKFHEIVERSLKIAGPNSEDRIPGDRASGWPFRGNRQPSKCKARVDSGVDCLVMRSPHGSAWQVE